MNSFPKNMKGFTLLEILVAIVIFSIVMVTLLSSFKAFTLTGEGVKNSLVEQEKIEALYRVFSADLESLFALQPPRYKKPQFDSEPDKFRFYGTRETEGGNAASYVEFSSLSNMDPGASRPFSVSRIAYYVNDDRENSTNLYRASTRSWSEDEIKSCRDPVLFRSINRFEVTYKNSKGEDQNYWDSDSKDSEFTLPSAVEIKIGYGSEENEKFHTMNFSIAAKRPAIE